MSDVLNIEEITDIEVLRNECRAYKKQMEVNNQYAQLYEQTLLKIAKMCGVDTNPQGSCIGVPCDYEPHNLAINAVKRTIDRYERIKGFFRSL